MNYWIQRADFEAEDREAGSASALCDAFGAHDWAAEEEYRAAREAGGEEWCPPGFGVVPGDGRILHICPGEAGAVQCHYHYPERRRILGLFPTRRQATLTWDGDLGRACRIIELFFDERHDDLVRHAIEEHRP